MSIKKYIPSFIDDFFSLGHTRTIALKRNALGAFFLKGLDAVLGFVRVPLIISFLSVSEYGIWLTLSSIIGWFAFFDIGLSSGLKTKLGEALSKKDYDLAKIYISTTYAAISIIVAAAYIIFLLLFPLLNWVNILNVSQANAGKISVFVLVFVTLFALQFVINIIGTILTADQKPTIASSIGAVSSVIYLVTLIILRATTKGSLVQLALACNGTSVVIFVLASIYFFKNRYAVIAPSLSAVKFVHFRNLASLGLKFFFIQISVIVMFSTDNMIITQLFTPADVAPYNIAFKYMGIPLMFFSILTWPLWAAYTDAYAIKDYNWIKMMVKKMLKLWALLFGIVILFLTIASRFYYLWLGDEIIIPFSLTMLMGIYVLVVAFLQIFVYFINAVGKIKLEMFISLLQTILNIPVSIFFAKTLGMGVSGVIAGTIFCLAISLIVMPIQYSKIISNNAFGVWDK